MKIARNKALNGREFGADLVAGPALNRWLTESDRPPLASFLPSAPDYVQIEAFLSAVENANREALRPPVQAPAGFNGPIALATAEHAARMAADAVALDEAKVLVGPELIATIEPYFGNHTTEMSAWLYSVAAAGAMRDRLREALDSGALQRLDAVTKDTLPPAQQNGENSPDLTQWANPEELVAAFGNFTDMTVEWFQPAKLADKPKLKAARKQVGKGGHSPVLPLFATFEVFNWLLDAKRRTGRPMSEATGWRLLKRHFPAVYAKYQGYEPPIE